MSGRKLKKGRLKKKCLSKRTLLSTDLDLIIKMIEQYLKDLKTEEKPLSLTGKTTRFQRFGNLSEPKIALGRHDFPISTKSTVYPEG